MGQAGITVVVPPSSGIVSGKLGIETEASLTFDELVTHLPDTKAFFGELTKRGWRYYFIDGYATVIQEVEVSSPYRFLREGHPYGGSMYTLSIEFGRRLPQVLVKSIIKLDGFVVNIASADHVRAVTIDLAKNEVTYVHDSLWVLKGKGCEKEARDVLKILKWLIEERNFKLGVGDDDRYRELVTILGRKQ